MARERRSEKGRTAAAAPVPELPTGVSMADWALERNRVQNPRLRVLLGLGRILEPVLDSNYAILHCSADRLCEIAERAGRVSRLLRSELAPLLGEPSAIPGLEEARRRSAEALEVLIDTDLDPLDGLRRDELRSEPRGSLQPLRKQLCLTIGKIHGFLQETLAQLLAADPRGDRNADYFLSRRFPQDIEEAEWLYSAVYRLHRRLLGFGDAWVGQLDCLAQALRSGGALPAGPLWQDGSAFVNALQGEILPMLDEVLALRGIRFHELELLDAHAREIPVRCRLLLGAYDTARELEDRLGGILGPEARDEARRRARAVLGRRMARLLLELSRAFQDLTSFVGVWLGNIEKRRALMLAKTAPERDDAAE